MPALAVLILLCSVSTLSTASKARRCPRRVTTKQVGKCDPLLGKQKDSGSMLAYQCYMNMKKRDHVCPQFHGKGKHYDISQTQNVIASSQLDPETNKVIEFNYKICNYHKICLGDNKRKPLCALHDYVNPSEGYEQTQCPPDLDPFLLTITRQYFNTTKRNVHALHSKLIGGDLNFMHYGPKYYPQWILSYYEEENVLLLFFQPSEAFRIPDFVAALDITHKEYEMGTHKIRILSGIAKVMDNAVEMHDLLLLDLAYTFAKYKIAGRKKAEMEFVISGYSLGGCYAPYFFLSLYGGMDNYIGHYADEIVGKYLPSKADIDRVSVLVAGSPLIVYHKDVDKISDTLRDRIFSIILGMDPIPMMWSGKNGLQTAGNKHRFLKLFIDVKHRLAFGSNAAIGRHQYVLSYASLQDKTINNIQKMDEEAIEAHLSNGGECLFGPKYLSKSMGAALKDFLNYHAKQYFPLLDNSKCLQPEAIKDIERTTFDIKYCKPKRSGKRIGVSVSKCYDYEGGKEKSIDFIDQSECDCYDGHGIMKHFVEGVSRLIKKQSIDDIGKKIHNSKLMKKIRRSKFLRRIGF